MDIALFFALLGGLLVLAFVANRLVRYTRVPDVIILMATGVVIGPVLHWANPDIFRGATRGFGALALMLILFEGGLDLKLTEILRHFVPGFFLSLYSYILTVVAIAASCRYVFDFSWFDALAIGAVLGCISSSIVLPVLQQVALRREVKVTLLVEASLGDALGVLAVTTLLDVASGGSASPKAVAWSLISSLILSVACGVLAGMLWSYLLPVLSEERFWHVLTFAAVLLVYSGVHFLKGNELVSVLVFGLTLSNFPAVRRRLHLDDVAGSEWFNEMPVQDGQGRPPEHQQGQMLTFHGELGIPAAHVFLRSTRHVGGLRGPAQKYSVGSAVFRGYFRGSLVRCADGTPRVARLLITRARADGMVCPARTARQCARLQQV